MVLFLQNNNFSLMSKCVHLTCKKHSVMTLNHLRTEILSILVKLVKITSADYILSEEESSCTYMCILASWLQILVEVIQVSGSLPLRHPTEVQLIDFNKSSNTDQCHIAFLTCFWTITGRLTRIRLHHFVHTVGSHWSSMGVTMPGSFS